MRLAAAQAWAASSPRAAELSRAARDFLTASERRRRRGIRRRNGTIAALAALTLALTAVTGYSLAQRATALSSYHDAESSVLAAASTAALAAARPDDAAEFAVLSERLDPGSPQALGALLGTQAQPITHRLRADGGSSSGEVLSVAYGPDGAVIAASTSEGYVRLWNASSYRQLAALRLGRNLIVHQVAFSPHGRLLAAALAGGVHLWNITDPAHPVPAGVIRTDTDKQVYGANAIAFSPDGQTLAAADSDGDVQLWNLTSRRLERTAAISAAITPAGGLAFAEQGRVLVIARFGSGPNGTVEVWNAAARSTTVLATGTEALDPVAVSPDGQTVAFGTGTVGHEAIKLWNLRAHRVTQTLTLPGSNNASSLASPRRRSARTGGCSR